MAQKGQESREREKSVVREREAGAWLARGNELVGRLAGNTHQCTHTKHETHKLTGLTLSETNHTQHETIGVGQG